MTEGVGSRSRSRSREPGVGVGVGVGPYVLRLRNPVSDQRKMEEKFTMLAEIVANSNPNVESESSFNQNSIWATIDTFHYQPENDITFESYFRRYEDIYNVDCSNWADQKKVRLLLRKLANFEHQKFVDYILPKKTIDLTFSDAVKLLTELFSPKTSLFHKRWKCMNLVRKEEDDYTSFASIVNKHCDDFRLSELSADNFKCLIFAQGLISTKDAEIRRRVLNKLENEPNLTLQKVAEDCQRFMSVKRDSKDRRIWNFTNKKSTTTEQALLVLKV